MKTEIEKEIRLASYFEHFKYAKELAMYLPIDHPKRIRVESELNKLTDKN